MDISFTDALMVREKPFPYKLYYTPVDDVCALARLDFYAAGYHCSGIDHKLGDVLRISFTAVKDTDDCRRVEAKTDFPPMSASKMAAFSASHGYCIKEIGETRHSDGVCTVKFIVERNDEERDTMVECLRSAAFDFVGRTKRLAEDPGYFRMLEACGPEERYRARVIGFLLPRRSGKSHCAFEIFKHLDRVVFVTQTQQRKMSVMARSGNLRTAIATWQELLNNYEKFHDVTFIFDMDRFSIKDTSSLLDLMDMHPLSCFIFVGGVPDIEAAVKKFRSRPQVNSAPRSL